MRLRRKIIIFLTSLILLLFVGTSIVVHAEEEVDENPIVEERDHIRESMEYYAKVIIEYVVVLCGSTSGLLIAWLKNRKILREVEKGVKSVETAQKELEEERKKLEQDKQDFINATKTLIESIKNQEEMDKLSGSVYKILEALKIIVSNDSKLVSSGVAKEIDKILSVEQEERNYDKQGEIHSV